MKKTLFVVLIVAVVLLLMLLNYINSSRNKALQFEHMLRFVPNYLMGKRDTNSSNYFSWYIVDKRKSLRTERNSANHRKDKKTWLIPLQEEVRIKFATRESVTKQAEKGTTFNLKMKEAQKTILIYTSYFGHRSWTFAIPSWDGKATDWKGRKYCPNLCNLTYDHKKLNSSDVIVFNARDMPRPEFLGKLMKNKRPFQRWVFFNRESPLNTFTNLFPLSGMFNWTVSYRLDSDIFQPDHYIHPLGNESIPQDRNYAEGKDLFVSWAVSNCLNRQSIRNRIVRQLLKYIPIDIYGNCQKSFGQSGHECQQNTDSCRKTMKRYKFYLAFENGQCYNYVTEKYWENALMNDIVPVVIGGSLLEKKLVVPKTYIDILDFPNAETLANYLKYLDTNDTAYNEYFWYKKYYKIFKPQFICRLCRKLYDENEKPKIYKNLFSLFNRQTNCHNKESSYIRNKWLRNQKS